MGYEFEKRDLQREVSLFGELVTKIGVKSS